MGYDSWVKLHLDGRFSGARVRVQNAELRLQVLQFTGLDELLTRSARGKFYADGNKDREISPEEVNKVAISDTGRLPAADIYSCGRQDAISGTEGSLDLIDQNSGTLVCKLQWICPHESSPRDPNSVKALNKNAGYVVFIGSYPENGPLGEVFVHWEMAIM